MKRYASGFLNFLKRHRLEIALFAVALATRVLFFVIDLYVHNGDLLLTIRGGDGYFNIAQNLLAGHGYSADTAAPYFPNPLRPPVFIAFIAGIVWLTGSFKAAIGAQLCLSAAIPLLARRVALYITPSRRVALGVYLIAAFDPYPILLSSLFAVETVFIFIFLSAILCLLSYFKTHSLPTLLAGAALIGLATLTKPTAEYLPLLFAALILWSFRGAQTRRALAHAGMFLLVFVIIIAPWLYYNQRVFGVASISAQLAYNTYVYLAPSTIALEDRMSFGAAQSSVTPEEAGGEFITPANSAIYMHRALAVIAQHPRGFILSTATTFIAFFTHDGMLSVLNQLGYFPSLTLPEPALALLLTKPAQLLSTLAQALATPLFLVFIFRLFWILITLGFGLGCITYFRKKLWEPGSVGIVLIVAYFAVTSIVGGLGVTARYRLPVDSFICIFALIGFEEVARMRARRTETHK